MGWGGVGFVYGPNAHSCRHITETSCDDDLHTSRTIVASHLVDSHMKHSKRIKEAATGMLDLLFTGAFAKGAANRLDCLKSGSALSRERIILDAAYLDVCCNESASRVMVRWAWGDSSPQCKRDWFLSK